MIAEGSLVVVYLTGPREKYWGRLGSIGVAGVHVRGLDLGAVEQWAREIARNEERTMGPIDVFFPLARVEKIFLDVDQGVARAVRSQFRDIVGRDVEEFL